MRSMQMKMVGQELKQIKEKIKEICDLFPESERAGAIDIPKESEIMPEKLSEVDVPEESLIDKDEEDEISAKGGRVNYANYRVDDTVPHFLSEDFTHKRPVAFEFDGTQYSVKDWKQFLLWKKICREKQEHIFLIIKKYIRRCMMEEKFPIVIYILKQHIVQIQYVTLLAYYLESIVFIMLRYR